MKTEREIAEGTATKARMRILVATDGSEGSAETGPAVARLADPADAEVEILTVLSAALAPSAFTGTPQDDAEAERFIASSVERAVSDLQRFLESKGFRVHVRHRFGHPADGILEEVRDWDADMVVLGRRDLSRPARWLLGSVSEAVTRRSHVPVLVAV